MLEREPRTYKEAVNSTEGLMWKEAINSEIESILHNLGNLWIFHQVVNLSVPSGFSRGQGK